MAFSANNAAMIPIISYLLFDSSSEPAFTVPAISDTKKQEFLSAINNARAQVQDCGVYGNKGPVASLAWNDNLYQAAYTYSYDMAYGGAWNHIGSGTEFDIVAANTPGVSASTLESRMVYYNYNYWTAGENIAAGQNSTASVIATWIASDGHCSNLMSSDFTEVGMALLFDISTSYYYYWTQNFGKPQ